MDELSRVIMKMIKDEGQLLKEYFAIEKRARDLTLDVQPLGDGFHVMKGRVSLFVSDEPAEVMEWLERYENGEN
jgi:hypothetical protein